MIDKDELIGWIKDRIREECIEQMIPNSEKIASEARERCEVYERLLRHIDGMKNG